MGRVLLELYLAGVPFLGESLLLWNYLFRYILNNTDSPVIPLTFSKTLYHSSIMYEFRLAIHKWESENNLLCTTSFSLLSYIIRSRDILEEYKSSHWNTAICVTFGLFLGATNSAIWESLEAISCKYLSCLMYLLILTIRYGNLYTIWNNLFALTLSHHRKSTNDSLKNFQAQTIIRIKIPPQTVIISHITTFCQFALREWNHSNIKSITKKRYRVKRNLLISFLDYKKRGD